uniref:FAD-binding protein n=1 Tax=Pelagibacter ubique TaxID=198252 RepID=UPI000B004AB7
FSIKNINQYKEFSKFDLLIKLPNKKNRFLKNIIVPLLGNHNIKNAVAALAVSLTVGISISDIKKGLKNFKGVQRRFNKIFSFNNVDFFDDYAHHPTEIREVLNGVMKVYKGYEKICIFQPHRISRVKDLKKEFSYAFRDADKVILFPIYNAGEKMKLGFSYLSFAKQIIKNSKVELLMIEDQFQLAKYVKSNIYGKKNCHWYGRWFNFKLDERITQIFKMNTNLKKLLEEFGQNLKLDCDLKKKNWFNIGGKAKIYFKADNLKDLIKFLKIIENKEKIFVLGGGSNTLITDDKYDGVVIKLANNFNNLSVLSDDIIIAGSIVSDKALSEFALENSLGGFEFLSCIPGTVGGGIKMNAGCFNREFKDILISIQAVTKSGQVVTIPAKDINFKYRDSGLSD